MALSKPRSRPLSSKNQDDILTISEQSIFGLIEDAERFYIDERDPLKAAVHAQTAIAGYQALATERLANYVVDASKALNSLADSFGNAKESAHALNEALAAIRRQIASSSA